MKRILVLVGACVLFVVAGKASALATTCDTAINVCYTATSSFVAGSGNVFDVDVTVDAQNANKSGFLTAIAMQFTGATSVTLTPPSGTWISDPGGLSANGCTGTGNFFCFYNHKGAAPIGSKGDIYTFIFAVTLPGSQTLSASSDIKAEYNQYADNSGKSLDVTSSGITINSVTPVPEPTSLLLMGSGLFGLAGVARRKFQSKA